MRKINKSLVVILISAFLSINYLAGNAPINNVKTSNQIDNSLNVPSTPIASAEGDVKLKWTSTPKRYPAIISADGSHIVAKNTTNSISFFSTDSSKALWNFYLGTDPLNHMALSNNGMYIVTCTPQQVFLLNNTVVAPKTAMWKYPNPKDIGNFHIDISNNGKKIIVGNSTGGLYLFNNTFSGGQKQPEWFYNGAPDKGINEVAISGNGQYIVTGEKDGNITLYTTTKTTPKTYEWTFNTTDSVGDVAISNTGDYLVVSNYEKETYLFNTTNPNGKPMWNFTAPNTVFDIDISSNGENVVVCAGNTLYYFNNSFQTGNKTAEWSYNTGEGAFKSVSVDITKDGKYVVMSTGSPATGYLFNNKSSTPKSYLWKGLSGIETHSASISDEGDYLIFGSSDTIYLYSHGLTISGGFPPLADDDDDDDDEDTGVVVAVVVIIIIACVGGVVVVVIVLIKKGIIDISKLKRG